MCMCYWFDFVIYILMVMIVWYKKMWLINGLISYNPVFWFVFSFITNPFLTPDAKKSYQMNKEIKKKKFCEIMHFRGIRSIFLIAFYEAHDAT